MLHRSVSPVFLSRHHNCHDWRQQGDHMNTQLKARAWRYASAALWGTGLVTTVQAQQATQGLEEIIVTARKVEENLQETPIAITALSGSALEDRQIFATDVLDQVVP